MKILVCGSRDWNNDQAIYERLRVLPAGSVVMHGAARGADASAGRMAVAYCGLRAEAWPADWKTHGKRAGIIRNLSMLDENPDLVIAFWDGESRGTKHTIDEARRRGIPVEIVSPADLDGVKSASTSRSGPPTDTPNREAQSAKTADVRGRGEA